MGDAKFHLLSEQPKEGQFIRVWVYANRIWSDTTMVSSGELLVNKYTDDDQFEVGQELTRAQEENCFFIKLEE